MEAKFLNERVKEYSHLNDKRQEKLPVELKKLEILTKPQFDGTKKNIRISK